MKQNTGKLILIITLATIALIVMIGLVGFGSYRLVNTLLDDQASVALPDSGIAPETAFPEDTQPQPSETSAAPKTELGTLFNAFWTTRELLHDNFINQPVDDAILAAGANQGIQDYLTFHEISLTDVQIPADAPTPKIVAQDAGTPDGLIETFTPFWETWIKLEYSNVLPEEANQTFLMRQALRGMVASLDDDYTNYFDPDLAHQYNTDLSGEYEGIGAWVDTATEFLTILSPIKNTPAEEAGLKPGDEVVAIDGEDMTGVDPNIALKRVLGPAGSKVILTIQRDELEPFDVEIIRRRIVIPYIETEYYEERNIAYISLVRFYEGGDLDFRKELESLMARNPDGLIVDVRGNGGGYLHIVVGIASEFLDQGNVLIEEFSDGSRKNYPTIRQDGIALNVPLVILMDGGSASASEILAGAIRDYDRGVLIGQTTFGKGSVQLPITLPDDQGLVSITIAHWLTPKEETIQGIGIEPDIFIEITEQDLDLEQDPQLEAALDYLSGAQ